MSDLAEADPAGSAAAAEPASARLLRDRSGSHRVTNIELFFDLVYVFAVTQLSHYLLGHATVPGALQAGLLLVMIWQVWVYTTWVTNWLDPDQMAVRLLLVVLMLVSLAMSASLPRAFEDLGLWIGGGYALQQIGRSVFMVIALRGHALQANFERILAWCVVSGALAVGGGFAHGSARDLLWLLAVGVDLVGGAVGFATPGLGRSRTSDWTIEGGHFAERCQGFILIALGESIVIIGATLTTESVTASRVTAFVVAFIGPRQSVVVRSADVRFDGHEFDEGDYFSPAHSARWTARMAARNSFSWPNARRAARSPAVAAMSVSGPPGLPYIRRAQPGSVANARALNGGIATFSARLPSGTGGWNNSLNASFASSHAYRLGLIRS